MNFFLKYITTKLHQIFIYIFMILFLCLSTSSLIFAQQTEQKEITAPPKPATQLPTLEELESKITQLKDEKSKLQDEEQIKRR